MRNAAQITIVRKAITSHPAVINVVSAANGLMRHMAIKPYTPRKRTREFRLMGRLAGLHAVRNQIFREKGSGNSPTIERLL